ncbi:peptidylprolyl isomerase fpr4 [Physocladia obscura]|uniref:FK506-binding protein n=1 Tax=Physocladia obscura TaxID=109957 RepID=A0AAD5SYK3_9FUNG|nr:peptidylprolyl isomerase fpr4 [Physocladia obscura]
MTAVAFWGLTCESETGYTQLVDQTFRLTNIAIDPKSTAKAGTRVSVSVQSGNNEFVIANLLIGSVEQTVVDLTFSEGEEITFLVTGNSTVHLTGNYLFDLAGDEGDDEIPDQFDEDDDDDDDDEDDDEDDEGDDDGQDIFFDDKGNPVDAAGNLIDISTLISSDSDDNDDDDDEDDEEEAAALLEFLEAEKNKRKTGEGESKKTPKKAKIEELPDDYEEEEKAKKDKNKIEEKKEEVKMDEKKAEKKKDKKDKKKDEKQEKKSELKSKVTTHNNGLIVEDVVEGKGPIAKAGNKVGVRYVGKLTNGKVFDSNTSGKAFQFKLGKGDVIKGWDIGVSGMRVGGARKLTIPPALAYGSQGAPPDIPKNATLQFEVKLLTIK